MSVTLSLFAGAGAQFFDNNGNPLTGGKIYTFAAGTTTPLATYTTASETSFHANPIVLDAAGRIPSGGELWLTLGLGYKFVVKTSTEVLLATYDNIPSSAQALAANDADSIMYEQGYTVTAGSFVAGKIYRIVSIGTTNFTLIGATANTVGLHFIATGVGTGTGTAELSQTVETKLRQTISVKDFGAVGDGVTDDTAAFQAFFDAGGGYVPSGTYMIDDTDITNVVNVYCDSNAIIKKRSGTAANSILIDFQAGSEYSEWRGGVIDGNRDNLKAAWAVANPTYPGFFDGWFGMKTGAAHIKVQGVTFQNFVSKPAWFAGDYNTISDILAQDHGDCVTFGWRWFGANKYPSRPTGDGAFSQTVNNVMSLRCDNDGVANVFQHAIDLMACENGSFDNLSVVYQGGDTSGGSTFCSGITVERCFGCSFSNWKYESPTADTLKHLGLSFLGDVDCTLSNPIVYDIAGLALELNGCLNMAISNPILDGNYKATTISPAVSSDSYGISYYSGVWNTDRNSKSSIQAQGCTIIGGTVQRFTRGGILRGSDLSFTDTNVVGNILEGFVIEEQLFTDYFSGSNLAWMNSIRFANCNVINNGGSGLNISSVRSLELTGGSYTNNGQRAAASTRNGINLVTTASATIVGANIGDTQSWTDVDTCSYEPQAPVNGKVVVYIRALGRIQVGQFINLVNAAGGADVIGKVVNIGINDNVTIETTSSLSATGNTAALTGTWSGSGTLLTGVGTSAITEILGQTYVTNGSEWRRIVAVASNTSIRINTAFTVPLSGATLTKLTVDVAGIPSQQNGIRAFGGALQLLFAKNNYNGNVVQKTNISVPANCIYGSEYIRLSSTNPTATNVNLQTQIPQGHRLTGLATNNTVAISGGGATSYSLIVIDAAAATLETIVTGVALAQNTKVTGVVGGVTMLGNNNVLRAAFAGGAPSAGTIVCEAAYRVDSLPALPSV